MKNALISPNEQAKYISSWTEENSVFTPVFTVVGERIAEVSNSTFEVAPPLFWVPCMDNIVADFYYYDAATTQILVVPPDAPKPVLTQQVSGTQNL